MDGFDSFLEILPQYRVIICTQCQHAIIPSGVKKHLRTNHKRLALQQRQDIIEAVTKDRSLAHTESEVIYPTPTDPPLVQFPVYFDGLRCKARDQPNDDCQYVCRTVYGMQEHCKEDHGWANTQRRGGNMRAKEIHAANKLWSCNVACQRFFIARKWQRYFEVKADITSTSAARDIDQRDAFFQSQKEDIAQAELDAAEDANRVRGFDDHRSTVVPWLRETGIVDHLQGLKKDEIKAATALPSPETDISYLPRVIEAAESMLREAHSWCFDGDDCMLTWPCRVVLSRFQSAQTESFGKIRPFDQYKEPKTLKTYFSLAKRVLAYFGRVAAGEDYFFSAGSDEESFRPEDHIDPTPKQLDAWLAACTLAKDEISADDEGRQDELKDHLLELWMLLICQDTGSRRYSSPLLSFCAMLSIKPSTQGWLEPGNFNSNLSAIIWVVQLLIFYYCARKERNGREKTLEGVRKYCERYLQQTVETPMGEILRWRLLLFRVSKDTVGEHEAFWDESEQVLTYEDTELHMDQVPTLLESEYRDCRRLLYDDLMFGIKDVRSMRAWALKDSANNDTVGWNFVQHRDNQPLVKRGKGRLLTAIEASNHLCRLFLTRTSGSDQGYMWRESAVASYEATVQELLKRLCVLIHISSGQPIRESEFFEMTWRNTQRRRSITICHDRIMIHVKYHKGQQQTGRFKENIRFLAHPVGELLLDYIVYVLPLRQVFLRQQSAKALLSPFLWEKDGKVWNEGRLSQCLEDASVRARVPRLHVANWRQMTVAIVKTKFASHINAFEANEDDEEAEEIDEDVRAMTKQRNHKTRTVNRAYANQTGAAFGNVWDGLIRTALRASTLWQDFWGVERILNPKKRSAQEETSRLAKRVAIGVYRPRKPWSAEALLGGARKLYRNEHLQWKSTEQEQAMTTIMSSVEQVVCVLPTGAGKSLLFMLPCSLPDARTTVLVVPLISLRGDLIRRMRELHIDYLEWLPGESRDAPLVVISVEAAGTKDFLKYARTLINQQKLDRIVVDECHLTTTAVEYRPSMVDLTSIRVLRTQFVYLTATLPPSIKAEFEDRNHLLHPRTIRASSNRPNIFYMVRRASGQKGSFLQQCAKEVQDAWEAPGLFDQTSDKIILYVRTRDEADELACILRCDSYTAGSGTSSEKQQKLDRWTRGADCPYIVATTALAEGFDYPHVRFVLNVNEPESLIVFAQESGRAGRDGKKAYSMVMLPSNWTPQDSPAGCELSQSSSRYDVGLRKQRDRRAVREYLRSDQCYRTSLTEYLDVEKHRRWCMSEDVPCDVCQTSHEEAIRPRTAVIPQEYLSTGIDIVTKDRLRQYTELAQYREHLAAMRGLCSLCRARDEAWDHAFPKCAQRHQVFQVRAETRRRLEARGKTWLKSFTACFWCLNPQSVCHRAGSGGDQDSRRCEFPDIVLPLCYGVYGSLQGPAWVEERFERRFDTLEEYTEWLGDETEFGGEKATQAVRVAAEALRFLHD